MNVQTLFKSWRVLVAVFFSMLLISMPGCDSEDRRQLIKKHQLENELKVGQVLRLSSLVKTSDGVVCILYPYRTRVTQQHPQSARINSYLEASGYTANESHWAFVVAEPERVHLSRFKRSRKLDIVSRATQLGYETQLLPAFVPTHCTSLAQAGITKIEWHNYIYLIMGEIR